MGCAWEEYIGKGLRLLSVQIFVSVSGPLQLLHKYLS